MSRVGGFVGHGRTEIVTADELTSVEDYRLHIHDNLPSLEPIELRITDALGLVLAEDVSSVEPLPSFANSAMDGYAVMSSDVEGASEDAPVELTLRGEILAGTSDLPTVEEGCAARIMTGGALPPGADAVIPVEVTTEQGSRVLVHRPATRGEFVRTVGQDVEAGERLLVAGHRVAPADVGLLAAIGASRVRCYPAPRVVVLSTGNELVPPEQRPARGQIRDANGPMLGAMLRQAGALPFSAGIVTDDRKALMYAFDSNLGHADLFIATGGASAGTHDLIADVIGSLGQVHAVKVAMQPGMPQVFGRIGQVPVFGLPGNPVSAFVSFEVFVRPAVRTLQSRSDVARPTVMAELGEQITSPPDKRSYLRVRMRREDNRWVATPTGHQGSHVITSVARADGLAEIPEDATSMEPGEKVRVHLLVD